MKQREKRLLTSTRAYYNQT